jgi:hypothetical protein
MTGVEGHAMTGVEGHAMTEAEGPALTGLVVHGHKAVPVVTGLES